MSTTGSTGAGLCITTSLHPVMPDRLSCHIPLPCGQALGDPLLHGHRVGGAQCVSGCICRGHGVPQWALSGLLPCAGIGQCGMSLCHGSAAADPCGGRAANTRRCSAGGGTPRSRDGTGGKRNQPRGSCATWGWVNAGSRGAGGRGCQTQVPTSALGGSGTALMPCWLNQQASPHGDQARICPPAGVQPPGPQPLRAPQSAAEVLPQGRAAPPAPGSGCRHTCEGTNSTSGIAGADCYMDQQFGEASTGTLMGICNVIRGHPAQPRPRTSADRLVQPTAAPPAQPRARHSTPCPGGGGGGRVPSRHRD